MAADKPRPVDRLPARSLIQPAAAGPMVCPRANSVVATASALPQASGARLLLTKPVTADGTISTLAPTRAADSHTPARLGTTSGKAAPMPRVVMAAAIGMPLRRPWKKRAQISGAMIDITPSTLHMIDVVAAMDQVARALTLTQATMNVM